MGYGWPTGSMIYSFFNFGDGYGWSTGSILYSFFNFGDGDGWSTGSILYSFFNFCDGDGWSTGSILYSFFNFGDGDGWSTPRPGRFTSRKETRYPMYRRPQTRFGRVWKPPPTFDHRTAQPEASH